MKHYRIFKCGCCGRDVNLCHSYTENVSTICTDCGGELRDTGMEHADIQWAIYVGVHKLFNWKGYQ